MDAEEAGVGVFSAIVWPIYLGAAMESGPMPPHTAEEPINNGYARATISWEPVPDDRQMVGRALIVLPPGRYSHWLFFTHPTRPQTVGVTKLDHPLDLRVVTTVEVYPILNGALELSTMKGVHP